MLQPLNIVDKDSIESMQRVWRYVGSPEVSRL